MDQPLVSAHYPAVDMDDVPAFIRVGAQFPNDFRVIAIGHEADVLAVGLQGHRQSEFGGDLAHLGFGQATQREAQIVELRLGRREQEIALVARRIGGTVQLRPRRALDPADIMAGRQAIGAQVARDLEKVGELHAHIAFDAGDRRAPGHIFIGKVGDHRIAKPAFIIKDIMGNADAVGDRARVANILPRATAPRAADRRAMVV